MRKFKLGDHVTPKATTALSRRRVYYWRYYFRGVYGAMFRGLELLMGDGITGIVRAIAPSVVGHPHEEFLVIDFCHAVTGKVERVGLHHSEVDEADPPEHEIPEVGKPIPAPLIFPGR